MSIKITEKILSIPPYISTSWSRICALHMKANILAITLADGDNGQIPNLDSETFSRFFSIMPLPGEGEHPRQMISEIIQNKRDDGARENHRSVSLLELQWKDWEA